MRTFLSLLRAYVRQVVKARRKRDHADAISMLRLLPAWLGSQGRTGLTAAYPWVTFEASRRIEAMLTHSSRIFEYGSGGSTLFLARRAASVVSVENDRAWFDVVRAAVRDLPSVELLLVPGESATVEDDGLYRSNSASYGHLSFGAYVRTIDRFPDGHFDLLLIDGRARPAAFFRGQKKVRVGGLIVLDDSDRSGYAAAVAAADAAGWPSFGRFGPKPFTPEFARTTVWTKTTELDGLFEGLSGAGRLD
jgi:hypothetical protein